MDEVLETQLSEEEKDAGIRQLYGKVWERRLETAWNKFEEGGFKPILIKGWAAAQLYPNPFERQYVDVDLMFSQSEYAEAEKFASQGGFEMPVDLHRGARHLDECTFEDLFENSVLKQCGATEVRVPREEDHLRILAVHWLNDGGSDRERLRDIYYGVANRSENFDWNRCLNAVSEKRRRWVVCAILLANRYMDLSIDDIPLREDERRLPGWVTSTVDYEWESGVRLRPLESVLSDRKSFWEQFRKRLLPNPIQATIETNGAFDNKPRIFYQLADILKRSAPSLKRIYRTYRARLRGRF